MKTVANAMMFTVFAAVAWAPFSEAAEETRPSITVSEEATIDVVPDKITVTFGIETKDMDMATAKQKNSDILKAAIAAAKGCGIMESEVQTDQLSILPDWVQDYGIGKHGDVFNGYFVRNSIAVSLNDPARVEDLIVKSLAAGVNYIHGVDFQTTEIKKYREQARELALKAAKEKADKMAAVLGNTVGPAIQISENYVETRQRRSYTGSWGHGRGGVMYQQAVGSESSQQTQTVALGKVPVTADVRVVFELK
jgi:uncharacterized protein YggE